MRVLFSNFPWWVSEEGKPLRKGVRAGSRWPFTVQAVHEPGHFKFGGYIPAPMFMGAAAAWMKRERPGWDVCVRDSIARGETYNEFYQALAEFDPDVFILETGAASWEHDKKVLADIKKMSPACRVGVAGPTTAELFKKGASGLVDGWILGEYDKTALTFADGKNGLIPFDILSREELRNVPSMMFDEEVWHHYADGCPDGTEFPELTVWASRGCYARCNFCAFPAAMTNDDPLGTGKRIIRFYDPAQLERFIMERVEIAKKEGRPIRSIRFDGDTENASDKHTLALCAMMKRVGIPWSAMCRADTSSREVWQAMKDSGCFGVKLGMESGSQRIIDDVVNKGLDLKEAEETCRFLASIGMSVHTTWMIGHPTETEEERNATIAIIKRFYAEKITHTHQLSASAVIEGTPLYNTVVKDLNYIADPDGQRKVEALLG